MKYPPKAGSFKLGPWPRGINNVEDEENLRPDELRDAENFVFEDSGTVATRPGTALRVAGTLAYGLHKVSEYYGLYFDNGKLYRLDMRSWDTLELASGFSSTGRASWINIGPRAYFTNGNEHGRVYIPTWDVIAGFGVPNPGLNVVLNPLGYGGLAAGRYLVGITYINSYREESACPALHFIELAADGGIGIQFSGSVPADVTGIRIYATGANGVREEMYRIAELDVTDTSFGFTSPEYGSPLRTLFLDEIPVPDLITAYNGYLFFAVGNEVWHSENMNHGLYHIDFGSVGVYPDTVAVVERGRDGIFVVADKTYSYVGPGPKDFTLLDNVFNYPASKYSGCQIEGSILGLDGLGTGDVPLWFSSRGPVIGLPGGQVYPVTKGRAEPDRYALGASGTIQHDGVVSVATAVAQRDGPGDSIGIQDSFSVQVVSRGITED